MSRPKAQDYCGFEGFTADHAHVEDRDTWTGLYDHNGQELHRPREPFGFQPHRWTANDRNKADSQGGLSMAKKKGKGGKRGC